MSGTVIAPVPGGATASFTVNRQTLSANVLAQPPVGNTWTSPSTWVTGAAKFYRGSMGANVKIWAYVPWKVTKTLASWYLGAATITLFSR